jgi:hypothetical protein
LTDAFDSEENKEFVRHWYRETLAVLAVKMQAPAMTRAASNGGHGVITRERVPMKGGVMTIMKGKKEDGGAMLPKRKRLEVVGGRGAKATTETIN